MRGLLRKARSWAWMLRACLAVVLLAPVLAFAQLSPAQRLTTILPVLLGGNHSTTTLTSSPNPSAVGQNVRLTATVTAGNPTGAITFYRGSTVLGSAPLRGGVAILDTSALPIGASSLHAAYGGDGNNEPSKSAAVSHAVGQIVSTVGIAATPSPSSVGQGVTLTATVSGASPSGQVTFKDGSVVLGTAAVVAGSARLVTSSLPSGVRNLRAEYAGDSNHTASVSATFAHTVNQVSLSVSPTSGVQGQTVTMVLTVTGSNPTGAVSFHNGSTQLATASLTNGQATFSTNALSAGTHSLTASYAGDGNNVPVSSAPSVVHLIEASPLVWQYGYDAMGRMNSAIDPNGVATYYYYDSLGRQKQIEEPPNVGASLPTVTEFGYNLVDGLVSMTDPRGLTTSYERTGLGTVTEQSSPDTGGSQFTYDAKGNVLSSTDARGKITTFAYDNLDRILSIGYPTGTATVFEYDGGTNPTPVTKGELTKMTDASGQTSYAYDALGRMTSKTVVIGPRTFTVRYGWGDSGSALDKLISITYPGGSRVNYGYDSYGSLSGITVNAVNAGGSGVSGTAQALLNTITYNASQQITGWQWADGKARTISYNSSGQIVSYTLGDPTGVGNAAGWVRSLMRDPAGRITGYTHTSNGTAVSNLDQGFTYDNLNRLLLATVAGVGTSYTYDATGNRTSKTIGGTTYSNTIAADSNRMTQVSDVGGTAAVSHDAAGHVTSEGAITFGYDDRGRMATASNAGGTVTYSYNGLEQRARKTGPSSMVPTGAAYYVYDEQGQILGEYDANGVPRYETVYLATTPVGVMKQAGTPAGGNIAVTLYNVHADQIDTPRVITRQDHTIVWRWDVAEAFGATVPDQNPSGLGAFVFNQRFPGQVFDAETGLFQNWHREYNARWGRYIQSDPIGLRGGVNTFAYVAGNPVSHVDPTGQHIHAVIGGIVGGVSAYMGAASDPCTTTGQRVAAVAVGAIAGAVSTAVPVGGLVFGSMFRNGLAGALGNLAGQTAAGGSINGAQVAAQATVGALSGLAGNLVAMNVGIGLISAQSLGVGTTAAVGVGAGINAAMPSKFGGMRDASITNQCECRR